MKGCDWVKRLEEHNRQLSAKLSQLEDKLIQRNHKIVQLERENANLLEDITRGRY